MPAPPRKIKKITTMYIHAFDIKAFKVRLARGPTLTI